MTILLKLVKIEEEKINKMLINPPPANLHKKETKLQEKLLKK